MEDYSAYLDSMPSGNSKQRRIRETVSVRATQWFNYQAGKFSLFTAYSPNDEDYFMQPEISYKVTDALSMFIGANIFGGEEETTFFGQFKKSDNTYTNLRFDF